MRLHGPFVFPKMRPGEDGETEINGGGIERIEGAVETFQKGAVVLVERTNALDEHLSEGFVDPPVSLLIGVIQRGELDGCREAEMIQLLRMCVETEDDAARTFTKRELPEDEAEELLPARKRFYETISVVHIDALFKVVP